MPAWTPQEVRRVVERAVDKVLATATADAHAGAGCGCAAPGADVCACAGETTVVRGQAAAPSAPARPAKLLDWTHPTAGDVRPVAEPVPAAPGRASRASEPQKPDRTVAIGGDHGGFALKESIKKYLKDELRYAVIDCGTHSTEAVDYPDVARAVASAVAEGRAFRGIVVDAAGIGSTMAANRVPGARCALCHDLKTVVNSRAHNDANVLALGSTVVHVGLARQMIMTWLKTPFEGGRHARRVAKIMELERLRSPAERTT